MKKHFLLTLLFLVLGLATAGAQSYQMQVKLNNGRVVKFATDSVAEVTFAEAPVPQQAWALPSTQFGATATQVLGSVAEDTTTRTAQVSVAATGRNITYTYYFDAGKKYKYALITFDSSDDYADYIKFLQAGGFSADTEWPSSTDLVYRNTVSSLVALATTAGATGEGSYARIAPSVIIMPLDETTFSWSRTDPMQGAAGAWLPLLGNGSTVDLMMRYEGRMGHSVNTSLSAPQRGVYRFATGNSRWTETRYWYDTKTKQFLEEAAIYCDSTQRPTPAEVAELLTAKGFEATSLSDGSSDIIYYNRTEKVAAFVAMSKPSTGADNFVPNIHFAFMDLSAQLPPDSVNFPWPVTDYGVYSLDEVIAKFKAMPYYVSDTTSSLGDGFHQINTSSPDFPIIIAIIDGGKYAGCLVGTTDALRVSSPYIPKLLASKGYEKYEGPAFPTYVNWTDNKEAQIINMDLFSIGMYFVAFEPNERTKN